MEEIVEIIITKGEMRFRMILAMSDIKAVTEINFLTVILGVFIILIGFNKIVDIISNTAKHIGKPLKWLKTRESDHDLILSNAEAIKNLAELHEKDNQISNEHDDMIREELSTFMTEVKSDIKQFTDNRVNDRSQSLQIQKELTSAQLSLTENVREISKKIDAMQKSTNERFALSEEKNNKRVQAEIKEKIAQLYRRHNLSKKITFMELEALEDLISTYEDHGGINSFVHSIVQKEMYSWEITE